MGKGEDLLFGSCHGLSRAKLYLWQWTLVLQWQAPERGAIYERHQQEVA